jgi:hypothetical protein
MNSILKKFLLYIYIINGVVLTTSAEPNEKKNKSFKLKKSKKIKKTLRNRKKKQLAKKGYKARALIGSGVLPINKETPEAVLKAARDAAKPLYTMSNVISEAEKYAQGETDFKLSNVEAEIATKISESGIKAAANIIFVTTSYMAFTLNPFTNVTDSSNSKLADELARDAEKMIKVNVETFKKQFETSNKLKMMTENVDTIIKIIEKKCMEVIQQSNESFYALSRLKKMIWMGGATWNLDQKLTAYNEFSKILPELTSDSDTQEAIKKGLAAHIILFGIKNFESELKDTLGNFVNSDCFKNLVKISSTKPAKIEADTETGNALGEGIEVFNLANLKYQKGSLKTLERIAKLLDVKLDFTNIIIPEGVQTTSWKFSAIDVAIGLVGVGGLASVGDAAYKAYQAEKGKKWEAAKERFKAQPELIKNAAKEAYSEGKKLGEEAIDKVKGYFKKEEAKEIAKEITQAAVAKEVGKEIAQAEMAEKLSGIDDLKEIAGQ